MSTYYVIWSNKELNNLERLNVSFEKISAKKEDNLELWVK